jgi:hypothetical protein
MKRRLPVKILTVLAMGIIVIGPRMNETTVYLTI